MKLMCNGCGRKTATRLQPICVKCSKRRIDDNGLGKSDGQIVYGLYDEYDELVYIGVSNSAVRRTGQHLDRKSFVKMWNTNIDFIFCSLLCLYHKAGNLIMAQDIKEANEPEFPVMPCANSL